jgi:hypothetical protein
MTDSSLPRPHSAESVRPRPQYGEYATPEEQLRRSGRNAVPAVVHAPVIAEAPAPAATEKTAQARPAHPVDRVAALALLAYGLWNVITSVLAFLDPSSLMTTMMQMLGISGSFSNYEQARTWGMVAAILLIVGWTATAALTLLRLRRGKLAWWVPLVGGAVFVTLSTLCMLIPFYADPAVISYLSGLAKK